MLLEDIAIRKLIHQEAGDAGVSKIEIERFPKQVNVVIHTAKPGMIIGRKGTRVNLLRQKLEKLTGKKIRLEVEEIEKPELDAYLVAKNVAEQLERRISYRRAMKQAVARAMRAGAKGVMIQCKGRLAGAEMARKEYVKEGRIPRNTLRADIDYALAEAHTTLGRIGVKVWIYKGDILPEKPEVEILSLTGTSGSSE